jgi:hypothetical protein
VTDDYPPPPRVFISYAYDSEQHKRQVHAFASFLRAEGGIDVRFDQWDTSQRRDWSVWMLKQFREAGFVIVVASPAYKRRAEGGALPADGRGVQFEAALLRDLITMDRTEWLPKILPVILPGGSIADLPTFLQPYSASRYQVESITIDGMDELYRVITGQPRHPTPAVGRLVTLPPLATPPSPWRSGQECRLGTEDYRIVEADDERYAPDESWFERRAVAERLTAPTRLVELRQVCVLRTDDSARRRRTALVDEGTLLSALADVPGIPDVLSQEVEPRQVTIVLSRPDAPTLRDLYGPPRAPSDTAPRMVAARVAGFMRTMYLLCRLVDTLHQQGHSHRTLTPDAVFLVDSGRTPMLRDIGLATVDPVPGEGVPPYRAPEQLHPDRGTKPGPRTDVFLLATIIQETLATLDDPSLAPRPAFLTDALSPIAHDRPKDAAAFAVGLLTAT